MARAFWKGTISFGMVAIPVRMSLAAESRAPAFHLLHRKCLTRPKQVLYCQQHDEYFSQKDTVRGYEYARERYVVFAEKDFSKVPLKTAHTIDILGFVQAKEIDPIYYHGSHYLEPEELGVKPFALLREALLKTGRVGIAKVAFQRREHLGCLRPLGAILALHTLHYQDELLPQPELSPPPAEVTAEELEMATRLVDTLARRFQPEQYRDEYAAALQKMVEAKLQGKALEAPPATPEAEIEDLMSALRASIAEAQKAPAGRK